MESWRVAIRHVPVAVVVCVIGLLAALCGVSDEIENDDPACRVVSSGCQSVGDGPAIAVDPALEVAVDERQQRIPPRKASFRHGQRRLKPSRSVPRSSPEPLLSIGRDRGMAHACRVAPAVPLAPVVERTMLCRWLL